MAEAVVRLFEAIEIHVQEREAGATPIRYAQELGQPLENCRTIVTLREIVERCAQAEFLAHAHALRYVVDARDRAGHDAGIVR